MAVLSQTLCGKISFGTSIVLFCIFCYTAAMFTNIFRKAQKHKVLAFFVVVIAVGVAYFGYQKYNGNTVPTRYVFGRIEKGAIVVSISGSGQVLTETQTDVKAKGSGDAVYVGALAGQEVKAGTLLAQLDTRDAQKSVRDAQANLESARLSLEKLKKPADALSLVQSQNALAQANESKQNAQNDLVKAYDDGFNNVTNAFLGLPGIITGLDHLIHDSTIDPGQRNIDWYGNKGNLWDSKALRYKDEVEAAYQTARNKYDKNFYNYK